MKFNYKEVGKEIGWNFSKMKHIVEQDDPYFYYHEVVKHITPNTVMLDIGCGSGEKAVCYFQEAKKVIMLDNEQEMLNKVQNNLLKQQNKKLNQKFECVIGDGDNILDFDDETFDLVVSRHCGANMSEVYRVLKKGGVFISEDIDGDDCIEIKDYFKRGQGYGETSLLKEKIFKESLLAGFSKISLLNFDQREYYLDIDELKYLLERTPIIGGYDENKDYLVLKKYCKDYSTEKGILLKRRLFAYELKK